MAPTTWIVLPGRLTKVFKDANGKFKCPQCPAAFKYAKRLENQWTRQHPASLLFERSRKHRNTVPRSKSGPTVSNNEREDDEMVSNDSSGSEATKKSYVSTWEKFLTFIFRFFFLEDTHMQSIDLVLPDAIFEEMKAIKEAVESRLDNNYLDSSVFKLCLFCLRKPYESEAPYRKNPMIHFIGILGVGEGVFREAYSFTKNLSALLHIARLLALESALPVHGWPLLSIVAHDGVRNHKNKARDAQTEYLLYGGCHFIGYLLALLAFGRQLDAKAR